MKGKFYILILLSSLLLTSCEKTFNYSPYVINFDEENTNVNAKNITKILNQKNPDNIITIAFTGDTHRDYNEFDEAVNAINDLSEKTDIDFVVHMGDIADFGLAQQYLWGNQHLSKLKRPYIVTLGNHDLVSNGGDSYHKMFGEYNFSFIYNDIKFVFANTNSMEFGFNGKVPDINWLDAELKPAANFSKAIILIHVPPVNADFDPELETAFENVITKYNNVICVIHGHTHSHSIYVPYLDDMSYIGIYSVKNMKFNVLKIENKKFSFSTYDF